MMRRAWYITFGVLWGVYTLLFAYMFYFALSVSDSLSPLGVVFVTYPWGLIFAVKFPLIGWFLGYLMWVLIACVLFGIVALILPKPKGKVEQPEWLDKVL